MDFFFLEKLTLGVLGVLLISGVVALGKSVYMDAQSAIAIGMLLPWNISQSNPIRVHPET